MDKEPESRHNFLQETFNKPDVFDSWKFQWPGDLYYSHKSNHSKGVPVLNARPCNLSWSGKIVMTDL